MLVCWVGLAASVLLALNIWPRATLAVCFVCFLSFIGAAQDFASYQSDGMLLGAGLHQPVFRAAGIFAGAGAGKSAIAGKFVSAAMGMVPDLFRIGLGQDGQRRYLMAQFHGHGRLLSEWAAADVDWLVRGPFAALVPRVGCFLHACRRTGAGLDGISAAPISDRVLLDRCAV